MTSSEVVDEFPIRSCSVSFITLQSEEEERGRPSADSWGRV
jgi:hypothetical protein